LIPAYNEEAVLGPTLESLARKSRPPDRVLVIADNCSDRTVEIARAHGVEVHETVGNTEKKAGAQPGARRDPA
jgi:glycosyltransferase involved in cell wall biosynthesis